MTTETEQTDVRVLTLRMTAAEKGLLERLCKETGLSQTAAVKQAIRLLAKREGVKMGVKSNE